MYTVLIIRPINASKILFLLSFLLYLTTLQCPQSCLQCLTPTNCTSCLSQNNLILVTSTLGCLPCPSKCQKCLNEDGAKTCKTCGIGYYLSVVSNDCQKCGLANCAQCNVYQPNACLTCFVGFYLEVASSTCRSCSQSYPNASTCLDSFILSCQVGYFTQNGETCQQCSTNFTCKSCSSASVCSTCIDGYYLNSSKCSKCSSTCLTCNNPTSCTTCAIGSRLNTSSKCQACSQPFCQMCSMLDICQQCISTYYLSNLNKKCLPLPSSNLIQTCTSYANNYNFSISLGSDQAMIFCQTCLTGTFLNINTNNCQLCSLLCQTCSGMYRTSKCTTCLTDYAITSDAVNGICTPKLYNSQGKTILYLNSRNDFIKYTRQGYSITNYEGVLRCPGGTLSQNVSVNIGSSIGYRYKVISKILIPSNTTSSFTISIFLNNQLISTQQINISSSIKICNYVKVFKMNFTFDNLKRIILTDNNMLKFTTLAANIILDVREILLSYDQCHSTCLICQSYEVCLNCKISSQYLQQQKCVDSCQTGYYLNMDSIISNNSSISSNSSYSSSCLLSCPLGKYPSLISFIWSCAVCISSCTSCTSLTICQACSSNYFYYNNTCVSTCPVQYYSNNVFHKCQKCVFPCMECIEMRVCTKCSAGFLQQENGTCVQQCRDFMYGNIANMNCENCIQPCLKCTTQTKCLMCSIQSNLTYYDTQCLVTCPSGTYISVDINGYKACLFCNFPCSQCTQTANKCTQCLTGFLVNTNFTCITPCPIGYFQSLTYRKCILCQNPCLTCINNQNKCLDCVSGYLINVITNKCLKSDCGIGYYIQLSTNSCLKCKQECYNCSNLTSCTICSQDYYLYNGYCVDKCAQGYFSTLSTQSYGICLACSSLCKTCFGLASYCISCSPPLKLQPNNTCLSSCLVTQLFPTCLPCEYPCYSCANKTNSCNSCLHGFYLFGRSCIVQCQYGYYPVVKDGFGVCYACQKPCMGCRDLNTCYQCSSFNGTRYYLQTFNQLKYCVSTCRLNQYPNNNKLICMSCVSPCLTCLSATVCTSCQNGYLSNGNCFSKVDGCPIGEYLSVQILINGTTLTNNTCLTCSLQCISCISSTKCTSCISSLYLYQSLCLKMCPSGTAQIKQLRKCLVCEYPCETCEASTTFCTKCRSISLLNASSSTVCAQKNILGSICIKYMLYMGECLNECIPTTYQSSTICLACISPCLICSSPTICTSCLPSFYMLSTTCLQQCPSGYYPSNSTLSCLKCQYPCKQCLDEIKCLTCIQGYLLGYQCLTTVGCPVYYYQQQTAQGKICAHCDQQCVACRGNSSFCIECKNMSQFRGICYSQCPDGYYTISSKSLYLINQEINKCTKCPGQCLTCLNTTFCSSCIFPYVLYLNMCSSSCPLDHMQFPQTIVIASIVTTFQTCIKCVQPCQTCIISSTRCLTCIEGYFLYAQTCVDQCQNGTYLSQFTRQCKNCMAPCRNCMISNQSLLCTLCLNGFYLDGNKCVQNCNQKFIDTTFQKCVSKCSGYYQVQKINSNVKFCSKQCTLPYLTDNINKKCVTSCGNRSINAQYSCVQAYQMNKLEIPYIKAHVLMSRKTLLNVYIQFSSPTIFTNRKPLINLLKISWLAVLSSNLSHTTNQIPFSITYQSSSILILQLYPISDIEQKSNLMLQFMQNSHLFIIDQVSKVPLQDNYLSISMGNHFYQTYPFINVINDRFHYIAEVIIDFVFIMALVMLVFNRYAKIYHFLIYAQSLFMIICFDMNLPPNLFFFLQSFKFAHFYQISNLFFNKNNQQKFIDFSYHQLNRIQTIFGDANFLVISGHLIGLFCILFMAITLFYLLRYLPKPSNEHLIFGLSMIDKKIKLLKWSHITDIFISTFMIILASFLFQTIQYSTTNIQQTIGIFISYFILFAFLSYIGYFCYKCFKISAMAQKQPKKFIKKQYMYRQEYICYFQGINSSKNLYKNYLVVFKIVIYGILTGLLYQHASLCLSVFIVLQVTYSLVYFFKQPYCDSSANIIYFISGLFHSLSLILILVIDNLTLNNKLMSNQNDIKNMKQLIGYFTIVFLIISMFLYLVQMFLSIMRGNLTRRKLDGQDSENKPHNNLYSHRSYKDVHKSQKSNLKNSNKYQPNESPKKIRFQQKIQFQGYSITKIDQSHQHSDSVKND